MGKTNLINKGIYIYFTFILTNVYNYDYIYYNKPMTWK